MNAVAPRHTARERQALDLLERHVAALNSGDLDAVLGDFGEHSVVITPDGVFEGLERIRLLYDGLLSEFGVVDRGDSPGFTLDLMHVRHDTIFIAWHAESMRRALPFGTDRFICDGGTFTRQSIAFVSPRPRKRVRG